MTVFLEDLIPVLRRELNPPGSNLFPTAVDDDWLGQLEDSFWEAKLNGFFANYTEADGLVDPLTGTTDLAREWQQLIVLFAGLRAIRMRVANQGTSLRAKAGPVEFDTTVSANVMNAVIGQLQAKIDRLLATLPGSISSTQTYYIDSLYERLSPYGGVQYGAWGWPNYDQSTG